MYILKTSSLLKIMRVAWRIASGSAGDENAFESHHVRNACLRVKRRGTLVAFDGEIKRLGSVLNYSIEANCLALLTPPRHKHATIKAKGVKI